MKRGRLALGSVILIAASVASAAEARTEPLLPTSAFTYKAVTPDGGLRYADGVRIAVALEGEHAPPRGAVAQKPLGGGLPILVTTAEGDKVALELAAFAAQAPPMDCLRAVVRTKTAAPLSPVLRVTAHGAHGLLTPPRTGFQRDGLVLALCESRDICVCAGKESVERKLEPIGTTLAYIPNGRFAEELKRTEASDEVKALADFFTKEAKNIVEPKKEDILNAAKNYLVARKLMAEVKADGYSMDCLGPVGGRVIPCPPCMAFLRLNDEGSVGACEADWNAAISLRLTSLLFGRPGFMQDPVPNTVTNTFIGAHCSSPTKLEGFGRPGHAPVILRSHSESDIGVSPQVLWPIGQKATVMKFEGPGGIILGTGKVVSNVDTPPSGGCRTSVGLELDGVADSRDTRGFHQLFILGDLETPFKAYCPLAGVKVSHI